jgi:cystathionine gamma-synthase
VAGRKRQLKFAQEADLTAWARSANHLWLFLDYDGTLAEFAPTPDRVVPDPRVTDLLEQLSANPRLRLAIISGRKLEDVHALVPVPGIFLGGTYGVELQTPAGDIRHRADYRVVRPVVERVKSYWAPLVIGQTGFFVEDKGWALALHARFASETDAERVLQQARQDAIGVLPVDTFRLLTGHRFLEVAPALAHKGETVSFLLREYPWPGGAELVYIGDDDKDEAAFGVVQASRGVVIWVAGSRLQPNLVEADYTFKSPAVVRRWLEGLSKQEKSSGGGSLLGKGAYEHGSNWLCITIQSSWWSAERRPAMPEPSHFETLAIHAGQLPDPTTGAVIPPIYQTSTYAQEQTGIHKGYEYSRTGNPTRTALETCLAALEGAGLDRLVYGLAFASGMAAIDTVLRLLRPGEHVLAGDDVYGGTYRLFERVLAGYGLSFSYVDMSNLSAVRAALRPDTRLVWLETPTNPLMKIADIAAIVGLARAHRPEMWVAVDNTFASPYLQQPLLFGADLVVHSTTKYLGGHSDVVGGALATTDAKAYERLKFLQNAVGAVPGPMDCWLTLRGIKTLSIRLERHSANAQRLAEYLSQHAAVERVLYPGLSGDVGYAIARRQMAAFGGMISFILKGGPAAARRVVAATRVFTLAESLGGVESLIEHPASMTHASVSGSPLEVPGGLVRLSVGIEHSDDLLADLEQALRQA